jgi:hypothetical protein
MAKASFFEISTKINPSFIIIFLFCISLSQITNILIYFKDSSHHYKARTLIDMVLVFIQKKGEQADSTEV